MCCVHVDLVVIMFGDVQVDQRALNSLESAGHFSDLSRVSVLTGELAFHLPRKPQAPIGIIR